MFSWLTALLLGVVCFSHWLPSKYSLFFSLFGCLSGWFLWPFWPSRSEMSNFQQSMFHVWIVVGYLGSSIPSGFVHLGVWRTGFILSEKPHEVDSVFIQHLSVIYFPSFKSQVACTVNVSGIGKLINWSTFWYSMAGTSSYLYRKRIQCCRPKQKLSSWNVFAETIRWSWSAILLGSPCFFFVFFIPPLAL